MKTFNEIDEEFICEKCGYKVPKLGYSCRNHCPKCLYSKHVDKNPGDRMEECHGLLEPIGIDTTKKGYVIIYKCQKCGAIRRNVSAKDDDMNQIIKISANH
jgi:ribosomal protein L37AE/L43A